MAMAVTSEQRAEHNQERCCDGGVDGPLQGDRKALCDDAKGDARRCAIELRMREDGVEHVGAIHELDAHALADTDRFLYLQIVRPDRQADVHLVHVFTHQDALELIEGADGASRHEAAARDAGVRGCR